MKSLPLAIVHDQPPCPWVANRQLYKRPTYFLTPTNATILPGVTIGDGAIIGAGAVVTRNVLPSTVVAGNPASVICTVDKYIEKCERNQSLYDAPVLFEKVFNNERPDVDDIRQFQEDCIRQFEKRDRPKNADHLDRL